MTEIWTFDRLDHIGGHPTTVLGSPRVIDSPLGKAVEFDGVDDALLVGVHPLAGAATFTWEAIFRPDGGARAQRWFHLQEDGSENRMLFEIRVAGDRWFLDAFAYSNGNEKALINREALHPSASGTTWRRCTTAPPTATTSTACSSSAFPIALAPQRHGPRVDRRAADAGRLLQGRSPLRPLHPPRADARGVHGRHESALQAARTEVGLQVCEAYRRRLVTLGSAGVRPSGVGVRHQALGTAPAVPVLPRQVLVGVGVVGDAHVGGVVVDLRSSPAATRGRAA